MIEIKNLSKRFKKNVLFEDVNLNLEENKTYGFVGPNGIGKSVFFKIISGMMKASSGEVIYNGKVIGKDIDFITDLGYMDNNAGFIRDLNGFENLKLLADIRRKIGDEDIRKLMLELDLNPDNKTKVRDYSLGMTQKLSFIQCIMEDPKVIIFDEPFNGMDKTTVKKVKEIILTLKSQNKIILLTSHIINDIEEIADIVFEFDNQHIELVNK